MRPRSSAAGPAGSAVGRPSRHPFGHNISSVTTAGYRGGDDVRHLGVRAAGDLLIARAAVLARNALREAGIGAAVGYGVRTPGGTISAALAVADEAMYADKRAAHAARA
jgi:hypothetical protein